jgi:soluble lytic murein transglycosylase
LTTSILRLAAALAVVAGVGCADRGSGAEGGADGTLSEAVLNAPPTIGAGSSDPDVRAAVAELESGRPFHATRRIAPALADPARRTPEAVLVAARAAAGWNAWNEVERLLGDAAWIDTAYSGEGREIRARSALARGRNEDAAQHAAIAVRAATHPGVEARRLVLWARALDRLDDRIGARDAYQRAAAGLAPISDWLALRAAGSAGDPAWRDRIYRDVRGDVARSRIAWTEAQVRERTGDRPGAITLFDSLGAHASSFRIRLETAADSAQRAAVRARIIAYLRDNAGNAQVRSLVEALDRHVDSLTSGEQLIIARTLRQTGPAARVVRAYSRAGQLGDVDRYYYGTALQQAGRWADAAAELGKVSDASPYGARAAYQRGRSLVRAGQGAAGSAVLRGVPARFPRDSVSSAMSLMLLSDLATDQGRDAAARATYLDIVRRYPTTPQAGVSAFRAAIIRLIEPGAAAARDAARELDAMLRLHPTGAEASAARYWSGRAHARLGDTATARARWRTQMEREPLSYYSTAAARRLGIPAWRPSSGGDTVHAVAHVDNVLARIQLLIELGMDVEARLERDALVEAAGEDRDRLVATAEAMHIAGWSGRGITVGWRAVNAGARDARGYRTVYPLIHRDLLAEEARRHRLDPALVAALIRQESSFEPAAVSPVGARGLMQLMPDVGRSIAQRKGWSPWEPSLLFDPAANIELGTTHLAGDLRSHRELVYALAAYNAGGSRVTRWRRKAGTDDPEMFIERIPFVETRDYVRIVSRNVEIYRVLYGL